MLNINFITKKNNIRKLQLAIGACLSVSAVMIWALAFGGEGQQKANISDTIASDNTSIYIDSDQNDLSLKALSETGVVSLMQGVGDSIQYYESQTGRAFKINLNTLRSETISDKRLPNFTRTIWSRDGKQVVSMFEEKNGLVLRYYNYKTNQTETIGNSASTAAFSPDGQQLAYADSGDDSMFVYVGQSDGTESRKIFNLRSNQIKLNWPSKNTISALTQRTDSAQRDLSLIGLDGSLKLLLTGRDNLEYAWSPSGTKILFSYYVPNEGVRLWLMNLDQEIPIALNIATSAAKCAWQPDEQGIVCGIPSNESLARDIPADKIATMDSIASIDLSSGQQNKLYSSRSNRLLSVGEPLVSSSGSYFVFKNMFDQKLYSLRIK